MTPAAFATIKTFSSFSQIFYLTASASVLIEIKIGTFCIWFFRTLSWVWHCIFKNISL